ncbi:acetyl-CoA C-acyltransferase [Corynebacterium aquatimens]|uniref:Probable acetyl-CoA acetyltransferase n=1 Tax=Corynebacterium aquatimens TaxID=1190508 RepID=A0A931DY76_9CORY|nr:acetyl-CoA C-acyltransferase [Corynebacterium aquatimens]MBG6121174.1 acetyl-CoA C-acetyltransferase [Corynebacterium aquatimens]WJY66272.1 putative acetyl-CoA acetyltransferase [Corynebacterium aquatimens]
MQGKVDGAVNSANKGAADVVIVGAARTPFGKLLGGLTPFTGPQLGGLAIEAALAQGGIHGDEVDAVILGEVLQAGVGQNPAKQAAIAGGVRRTAHTSTVNKVCLSGMEAVINAARIIRCGEADVVVAGGMESMSNAPHLLHVRKGIKYGSSEMLDHMAYDGLTDAELGNSMGALAEDFAREAYPASREDEDRCAALSHQRAHEAAANGTFAAEITPVTVVTRKGDTVVDTDEGVRGDVTPESLGKLRPAFEKDGTITAGNSSPLTDGAAAVVLTTRENAEAKGWKVLATLRSPGQIAGDDSSLQIKPALALRQALDREGWTVDQLDHIEINEAFAAVIVASAKELGVEQDSINPHGGAIAMGHPIGASGARLIVHAAHQIAAGNASRAGLALCGGGGQGEALLLEA